jgi:hypothetical protein
MVDRMPRRLPVRRIRPRFPAPPRRGGRDPVRLLILACAFASVFALAHTIGTGSLVPSIRNFLAAAKAPPASPDDDDLTTGSIVFVPVLGNECRQNVIDNATWQIREIGKVPCDEVLAQNRQHSGGPPNSRLEIISESFRR